MTNTQKSPLITRTHDITASWVIKEKTTGRVLFETFSPKLVEALNTTKYEAIPIMKYLQILNRSIRAAA